MGMRAVLGGAMAVGLVLCASLLPVRMAHACSCIDVPGGSAPYEQVAGAAAVVVGTVRAIDVGAAQGEHGRLDLAIVDVETAVHHDVGPTLEVPVDRGSDCAVDVQAGDWVAWTLHDGIERWGVGLCGDLDPAGVLAALALPEPTATGPPAYAATGPLVLAPTVLLDAEGRILGYGAWDEAPPRPLPTNGRRPADVRLLDVCDDGAVVEYAGDHAWAGHAPPRIVLRDPVSGVVRWAVAYDALLDGDPRSGPNVFGDAACLDDGSVLATLSWYQPPEERPRRLVRLDGDGFELVAEGTFHEVLPAGDRALTRLGTGERLAWLDLRTGATSDIVTLPDDAHSAALDADGDVAWVLAGPAWDDPGDAPHRLLRVDLAAGTITDEVPVGGSGPQRIVTLRTPAEGEGVWVAVRGPDGTEHRRHDDRLAVVAALRAAGTVESLVERDGRLLGIEDGQLVELALPGGSAAAASAGDVRAVPVGSGLPFTQVLPLPAGLPPVVPAPAPALVTFEHAGAPGDGDGGAAGGGADTPNGRASDAPDAGSDGPDRRPGGGAVAVLGLAVLGLAVLVPAVARRRGRRDEPDRG